MCEPTLIAAATIGITGATSLFSAGTQARAGERTARLSAWQALQETAAGFEEAGRISAALSEQFGDTAAATVGQVADVGRALTEQLSDTATAALDQAGRATASYGLAMELARKNAELALSRGNVEENHQREATGRALAGQTAFFSANNIDPSYGSPLLLQAFGAAQGEADALIIRANASQEAAGYAWQGAAAASAAEETVSSLSFGVDSAFKAASRQLDSTVRVAGLNLDSSGRTTARQIESAFVTAGNKSRGLNTTAAITGSNARQAGQLGAVSTLMNTAVSWANLAMGGKLQPLGIKGA